MKQTPLIWLILASLSVHMLVFAVFAFAYQGSDRDVPAMKTPRYIEAKLVTLERKAKPVKAKTPQKVDLTKRKKVEQNVAPKNQQPKREAPKKPEPKPEEKVDTSKQAEELKRKQRLQQLQAEMEMALSEEEAVIAEDEFEIAAQSYIDVISQRIEQNWSRPPSARNGMRCVLLIQLVPTGRVVSVSIVESSGNSAFDRSAEQAVKKVDRFPEVQEMEAAVFERYYRRLKLVFNPQDLRQ
jgi:colicin import membrane protein